MKHLLVMDIETFEEDQKVIPFLFALKSNTKFYTFYGEKNNITSLFLNQIENECRDANLKEIEVYTHNINFDGYVLIEYFLLKNIPFKWFLRNLNLYFLKFTYKGAEITIRCSYKLLGLSVEKLGEMLNVPKKSFPYKFMSKENMNYVGNIPNFKYFESKKSFLLFYKNWGKHVDIKRIAVEYAFYDVKIVWESLENLFKISKSNLLRRSFSFSSYSYKLFKRDYDFKKITKNSLKTEERVYIENAYFGGRTEIFGNTQNGFVHRFDFPGMYGSCMKEKFPFGKPKFTIPQDFKAPGFYAVTVFSDLKIPILPIRCEGGKIQYPNGRFTTVLTRDEFIFFINNGGKIEKIHSGLTYPDEDYIFKDFVEDFEKIKKKSGFYKLYGKSVINSLYGSFALKKEKTQYEILYNEDELGFLAKENRLASFTKHGNMIIACVKVKESLYERENRNFAYSALISAKARIKLHDNLYAVDDFYTKKYGKNYKLLYLETDSIDVSLPERCINEKIKEVTWQKIYEGATYISPKFYLLKGEKHRIKGVRNSNYSYEDVSKMFYENSENLTFKSQLQFEKKNFNLAQTFVDKTLKLSAYDKRKFINNKLDTETWWVEE